LLLKAFDGRELVEVNVYQSTADDIGAELEATGQRVRGASTIDGDDATASTRQLEAFESDGGGELVTCGRRAPSVRKRIRDIVYGDTRAFLGLPVAMSSNRDRARCASRAGVYADDLTEIPAGFERP
jgi:hypothetical protein